MSLKVGGFIGQSPLPETIGDVWTIEDVHQSGLVVNERISDLDALQYYVRESSLNMWKFLSEPLSKPVEVPLLSITGDPGCGKSTLLYGWVRHRSTSAKVLWTSVNQLNSQIYIRVFDPTGVSHMEEIEFDTLDRGQITLKDRILAILATTPDVKHVVMDGITSYRIVSNIVLRLRKRSQSIVVCTSLQAAVKDLPVSASDCCTLIEFTMEAWSLSELLDAQRVSKEMNKVIFDTEITNSAEAFYERFQIAGCSMRYMTSTDGNTETVRNLYNCALQTMSGEQILSLPSSGITGIRNLLYQHRYVDGEWVTSFASRYVEDRAVARMESTSVSIAALLDPTNNALQGWLYEIRIRLAVKRLVRGGGGVMVLRKHRWGVHYNQTLTMRVQRYIDYDALPAPIDLNTLGDGWSAVYLPTKHNQGCFDAVYVVLESFVCKVYFLQFTIALSHDAKLQYAGSFLGALLPNMLSKSTVTRSKSVSHASGKKRRTSWSLMESAMRQQSTDDEAETIVQKMSGATISANWSASVHFYFVLPKENVSDFKVGTVEEVGSVSQFDKEFSERKIRTAFVESVTDRKNVKQGVL